MWAIATRYPADDSDMSLPVPLDATVARERIRRSHGPILTMSSPIARFRLNGRHPAARPHADHDPRWTKGFLELGCGRVNPPLAYSTA